MSTTTPERRSQWRQAVRSGVGTYEVVSSETGKTHVVVTLDAWEFLELLDSLDRVETLCDAWDRLSKGESPTTAAIRAEIRGDR